MTRCLVTCSTDRHTPIAEGARPSDCLPAVNYGFQKMPVCPTASTYACGVLTLIWDRYYSRSEGDGRDAVRCLHVRATPASAARLASLFGKPL